MRIPPMLVVLLVACHSGTSSDPAPVAWNPLPGKLTAPDDGGGPEPSICGWALAADEVVWGTVVEVRLPSSPAVRRWRDTSTSPPSLQWDLDPGCSWTNRAMEIDIEVAWSLHGSVDGVVTVALGARQKGFLSPSPNLDDDGSINWALPPGYAEPLAVGTPVGMPIHHVSEYDVWSLMGELMFSIDSPEPAQAGIMFQSHLATSEPLPPPPDAVGLLPLELRSMLTGCSQAEHEEEIAKRKLRVQARWGPDFHLPDYYFAATCLGEPEPPCVSDADCPDEFICYEGECHME
jgi:hypothetical protein